jgi:DNA-binding IclR family transcriptional regulator
MTIMPGLRSCTRHTVTAPDRFRRALAVIQLTRVAVTRRGARHRHLGVAVPVFGPGSDVVAAIELNVPDLGRNLHPITAALSIASRSLSRELAADAVVPGPRPVPDLERRVVDVEVGG